MFTRHVYQTDSDYWRLRAFLREVYTLRDGQNWPLARLDYWRYFVNTMFNLPLEQVVYWWENASGQIVAVLNPENPANAYFHGHPHHQTPELIQEMVHTAETHLTVPQADNEPDLTLWAYATDTARVQVFEQMGYVRGDWPEYQRRRSLLTPIPTVPLAEGYTLRAMGDKSEWPARSWLSWRVFHPDEPDSAYEGWEWYEYIQRCPLYRRDLDVVAVAPNGELAAFCTVWFDDVTRSGEFEPVGVSPDHQQRGLGKAILTEALRRLQHLGGLWASVGGYSQAANALYASVISPEYVLVERWHKAK